MTSLQAHAEGTRDQLLYLLRQAGRPASVLAIYQDMDMSRHSHRLIVLHRYSVLARKAS